MKIQVLVSTMYQTDHSILDKMNIQTDAIIINQCSENKIEEFDYKGNKIKFLSFNERGVGLSRNNALMRTSAEICIFADEDVTYEDDYQQDIINAFKENPKADIILFNILSKNPTRPSFVISNNKIVRRYNCLKYGAVRIAAKTERIKQANIYFSLLFGGGAKYSSGEDSLFLFECIKKGLKVYKNQKVLGYVSQENSTWFNGYTDKFFDNKGVFYYFLSKRWAKFMCLQFVIRHRKMFGERRSWRDNYRLMIKGIEEVKKHNKL